MLDQEPPTTTNDLKREWDWPGDQAEEYRGDRVYGQLWRPASDLFVTRVSGHVDVGCVSYYVSRAQRAILAGHKIAVFHDWSKLTGYDLEARNRLRAFGSLNDEHFQGVYYLIKSKIIMMAISAAALALRRRLYAYTDALVFREKLRQALAARSL